ncbi:molybdate ABC transporter substrate-binding protein [Lacibacterium aquatile]|uniref:Molybdate ABC transporter substrate-binding protein n=1 Tax=Lacibacterium aquatile TaxID=1168082 RepID=A0ABW5DPW9_9PROT
MTNLARRHLLVALAALPLASKAGFAADKPVTVLTVPALVEPLKALLPRGTRFIAANGAEMPIKIESEIAADLIITDNPGQLTEFSQNGRTVLGTERSFARDRLALAQRSDQARVAMVRPGIVWQDVVEGGNFGILAPEAGITGERIAQTAEQLGVQQQLPGRAVPFYDLTALVASLKEGTIAAAFLPHALATGTPNLEVVGSVPETLAAPIVYSAALIEGHDRANVRAALEALSSVGAREIYARFGLLTPLV